MKPVSLDLVLQKHDGRCAVYDQSRTQRHRFMEGVDGDPRAEVGELARYSEQRVVVLLEVFEDLAVEDADTWHSRRHDGRDDGPEVGDSRALMRSS